MTPLAGAVLAHGLGGRDKLALPLPWTIAGAAIAIVLSFVALGVLWSRPRIAGADAGRPLPGGLARVLDSRGFRAGVAAAGVMFTLYVLLALVFGRDDADNPMPWVVFVWMWIGLVPLSVLFGPVWRLISPLRTLHTGVNRLAGLDPGESLRPLPDGLGWWPAAAGLLAFTWLELIAPDSTTLPVLQLAIGFYVAVQLLAALLFGRDWFTRGELFEAWSGLFGRLSALGRRRDGTLVLRNPLAGLDALPARPGLVATVTVMLASTAFDSVGSSAAWDRFALGTGLPRVLVDTAGLLGVVLLLGGLLVGCTAAAGLLGGRPWTRMPGAFAPSVVPVALGYVIAHYYTFGVMQGQQALVQLSDPLGIGADWLGTADRVPDASLIRPSIVANLQVVVIVLGHVLGLVLAHDRAVRLFPPARAVLGQLPLLLLMITLTCCGLLLLFTS